MVQVGMDKFKNITFKIHAINHKVSDNKLMSILTKQTSFWRSLFCLHNWVYWRFANFGKMHRVCKKCYKKQKNSDPLNKSNYWVHDDILNKLPKQMKRKSKLINILSN